MFTKLTSFFYRTSRLDRDFSDASYVLPSKVIFTNKDVENIKSLNWVFSRRLNMVVYKDRILLGSKEILINEIKSIECYKLRSIFNFMVYSAFKIKLPNDNFIYVGINNYDNNINKLFRVEKIHEYSYHKFLNPGVLFALCIILIIISFLLS